MRNILKIFLATSFAFTIFSVSAQTYSGFSDITITLRCDSSTKSALISNLLEDRIGDISPIIGTAAWTVDNKRLQCRSLLSFNYGVLPKMISPDQIIEARLILRPVEILTSESANGVASPKFSVRRITGQWEDSMTSWLTQPASNDDDQVIKSIPEKKKYRTVRIDVTKIVRNMFRYGNNGFMLQYEDSLETSAFLSQWFASAKYEDEKFRPELQIRWSYPVGLPYPGFDLAENSRMPVVSVPSSYQQQPTFTPPAPVPVAPDNPSVPPKNPVKD